MSKLFFATVGLVFLSFFNTQAQSVTGFDRIDSVRVFQNAQQLLYPWAGGMNYVMFSEIDLNLDGINDLFVFDRTGNKITTYLNNGTPNQVDYVLAPQYVSRFPLLHDWAILRDYNCDGKADIFTYSIAGFSIWKNTSTVAGGVSFQLVQYLVNTDRSPNSSHFIGNLFVSQIDIPAIRDMDGDGDLDVLTYENGGGRIEYHKNMGMELYGTCDSVHYIVSSNCWGELTENALNAQITLGTTCPPPPDVDHADAYSTFHMNLHSGSCIECINTNNDNDQDVIIGDISSSAMAYVRNGGTTAYAIGDLVDQAWPNYDSSVTMDVFNCGFHLDVNNDGLKDVIICPQAQNTSEDHTSVQYYKNTNTNSDVQVTFVQDAFMQDKMIDLGEGSYPVFYDYDNDGDSDLVIGNFGYYDSGNPYKTKIALLKNTGTSSNPVFDFTTDDFANIYANVPTLIGMAPAFGDLDGDGDKDLLCGDVNGKLNSFVKMPGPADNFVTGTMNYAGIDVGSYATPQLIDVDRDGLIDLLIGEQSGNINYYRNTGTAASPVFTLVTQTFGNIIVNQTGYTTGYSAPCMYDDNGQYVLLVGSERGYVFRFDNIDGNLAGTFTKTDSMYVSSLEGARVVPAVADLNGDGLMDVVIGNYSGGVSLFYGDNNVSTGQYYTSQENLFTIYPDPANEEITISTPSAINEKLSCDIYDISGKKILSTTINSNNDRIQVGKFAPGIYFTRITSEKGVVYNNKFVISR